MWRRAPASFLLQLSTFEDPRVAELARAALGADRWLELVAYLALGTARDPECVRMIRGRAARRRSVARKRRWHNDDRLVLYGTIAIALFDPGALRATEPLPDAWPRVDYHVEHALAFAFALRRLGQRLAMAPTLSARAREIALAAHRYATGERAAIVATRRAGLTSGLAYLAYDVLGEAAASCGAVGRG